MNSKSRFKKAMARLGEHDLVDDEISRTLGKFVCPMYDARCAKYVNALGFNRLAVKQNTKK